MRRKLLCLLALIVGLTFNILPVSAATKAACTITGSTTSYYDGLIVTTFSFQSDDEDTTKGFSAISGTITYPKADVVVLNKTVLANGWKVTFTEKTTGTITFTATSSETSGYLKENTALFKINFAVSTSSASSVSIVAKSLKATMVYLKTVVDEPEGELPEGETPTSHTEDATKSVTMDNVTRKVTLTKAISADCYLRSATFTDGTLEPAFTKKTNSYEVTTTQTGAVSLEMIAENPDATVSIGEEINNQIIVTVTAPDGKSTASYLFTIKRTNDPTQPNKPVTPTFDKNETTEISTSTLLLIIALFILGAGSLTMGIILLNKGSHNQ